MKLLNRIVLSLAWVFTFFLTSLFVLVLLLVYFLNKRSIAPEQLVDPLATNAVGVVELSGEIFSSDSVREQLAKFIDQPSIKAIVLRIDSPGGTLGASEEIYHLVQEASVKKPVVCSLGSIAASGGLYVANACKKVVANKGTITGSIGVIFMTPYFGDLLERLGLKMSVIKSGKYKDAGSPFRALEDGDKEVLQAVVDQGYEQFVDLISKSRNLPRKKVKEFADGRVFLGEKAFEFGLVDHLGGLKKAGSVALELAGVKDQEPKFVYPEEQRGFFALLRRLPNSKISYYLDSLVSPKFLYR